MVTQPTEETITNGIIRVTRPGKKVVYFTEGFGEAGIEDAQDPKGFASAEAGPRAGELRGEAAPAPVGGADPRRRQRRRARRSHAPAHRHGDHRARGLPEARRPAASPWSGRTGAATRRARSSRASSATGASRSATTSSSTVRSACSRARGWASFRSPARTARTPSRRASATSRSIRRPRSVEPAAEGKKGLQATALVKTSESSWAETDVDGVLRAAASPASRPRIARARCRSRSPSRRT